MDIQSHFNKKIKKSSAIFFAILTVAAITFAVLHVQVGSTIQSADPIISSLNHMVQDLQEDNGLLLQYIATTQYSQSIEVEHSLKAEDGFCQDKRMMLKEELQNTGLSNPQITTLFAQAEEIHNEVENTRNELIQAHKNELAMISIDPQQKAKLFTKYSTGLSSAITNYEQILNQLSQQRASLQNRLQSQIWAFAIFLITAIVLFTLHIKKEIENLSQNIISPLDQTIKASEEFSQGNFHTRTDITSNISQIATLQNTLNNVFEVVEKVASQDHKAELLTKQILLQEDHKLILLHIQKRQEENRVVHMDELRKVMNITYPTLRNKIKFLKENHLIQIQKQGREKHLLLTTLATNYI